MNNISMITLIKRLSKLYGFYFSILFFSPTAWSQDTNKKVYTSDSDSLWSKNIYLRELSNDGKWITFSDTFDKKESITQLYNTTNSSNYKVASGQFSRLTGDNKWFSCITINKELHLIQLKNGFKTIWNNVLKYDFSNTNEYICIINSDSKDQKKLIIKNLKTFDSIPILNVIDYVWHPIKNTLLIKTQVGNTHTLWNFDLDTGKKEILKEIDKGSFQYLVWSASGNAFAFLEMTSKGSNKIYYKNTNEKTLELNDSILHQIIPNNQIAMNKLSLSDDGKKLFFYKTPNLIAEDIKKQKSVEIWNSSDIWEYPQMKLYQEQTLQYQLTTWHPLKNKVIEIADNKRPSAIFNPNHLYALTFNRLTYEPLYKADEMVDFFITNTETGLSKKIINYQYTGYNFVKISPSGRYITYFKNNNWWVYDTKLDKTASLTEDIDSSFHYLKYDKAGEIPPYGNPGWATDESKIIIYDQHDIWVITPDGKIKKRLTKGKENKKTFIIDKSISSNSGYFSDTIHFDQSILLFAEDEVQNSGYHLLNANNSIVEIIYEPKKHSKALISKNHLKLVYTKESYNEPVSIHYYNHDSKDSKIIYQSNKDLLDYDVGASKLIYFTTSTADTLKGVLIYPAQFNPSKKYPMVVHIYERMSNLLHEFAPPSEYNIRGFNPIKYAVNGYFMFYPDITYIPKKPGFSALDCITSGVNKVIDMGYIDKERIGLIGQSFGGYETLFTITHSDMFAAAVAGASTTDYTSRYHSIGASMKSEIYRFENHQHRMGDSYYNIKEDYLKNSPLNHIENLSTPILLWSGKEDYHVNWTQSVAFYMGMKRLNKEGKLLLYEKEGHALRKVENQKHLSDSVFDWFNQYLKQ